MPSPRAIRVQFSRSADVPWSSRGNHAKGTEILRPSESSTLKASSDAVTDVASGITVSLAEVVIPGLQQVLGVLVHETSNVAQLCPSETTAAGKANRIEPELGNKSSRSM
jgi:hypothetical protein